MPHCPILDVYTYLTHFMDSFMALIPIFMITKENIYFEANLNVFLSFSKVALKKNNTALFKNEL